MSKIIITDKTNKEAESDIELPIFTKQNNTLFYYFEDKDNSLIRCLNITKGFLMGISFEDIGEIKQELKDNEEEIIDVELIITNIKS